jgi:hypothetical protein
MQLEAAPHLAAAPMAGIEDVALSLAGGVAATPQRVVKSGGGNAKSRPATAGRLFVDRSR